MQDWEEAIMTYQNYLNYYAWETFSKTRRFELLKEVEDERLRSRSGMNAQHRDQIKLLLQPAHILSTIILNILRR